MPDQSNIPQDDEVNGDDFDVTEERYADGIQEPPVSEEDTDDLDPRLLAAMDVAENDSDDDEDVPFKLPKSSNEITQDNRSNPHKMVTMPHFAEPGAVDPRITLPGTGGLDPNPDMVNNEKTVRNMPRVQQDVPPQRNIQPSVPRPDANMQQQRPPTRMANSRPTVPNSKAQQSNYMPPSGQQQRPPNPLGGNGQPPKRRRRRILGLRPGCFYMTLGLLLTFCGGLTFMTMGAAAIFIPRIEAQWEEEIAGIENYRAFETTFYYDRYGNLLYEKFGEGRRDTVNYQRFPQDLINATISIEDDTFFQNLGIDVAATLVATFNYLTNDTGERTAGGSSITQQVVRNVLFDFEKRSAYSVSRKVEEIILSVFLTTRRSKEDILELYLNEIYYGNLSYGAQAASQTFFGKNVEDITLGEAALLAGLPQSPANLDPLNPDPNVQNRVYNRWRLVLSEMVEEGYITQAEMDATVQRGLEFYTPAARLDAPHFTVYAQSEFANLMEEIGYEPEDVARGGYRVYTTIDQNVNNAALGAARTQVASLAANNVSNASVVVIQPITGQIMAMVGSIDYNSETIDGRVNVSISLRQPGSTMKPFTYAAAMERGMTAADVLWDTPTEIGIAGQPTYVPRNYDGRFHGPMYIREALANSYNIPAVQAMRLIGVDSLIGMMNRVGVTTLQDPSRYGISLTLGGGEVSLLELTNAYGVFANQGAYVDVTSILCVVDSDNNIIYQYENGCPQSANFTSTTVDRRGYGQQVVDPRIAYIMTDILSDNAARTPAMGSRSNLYTPNIETSVKTGTTNDVKDNWTMGYTRNVAIGVWVGNNDGQPMRNSSGLTGAAPIWNSVMSTIYNDQSLLNVFRADGQLLQDKPSPPPGMSQRRVCNLDTLRDPVSSCGGFINEWLLDGPAGIPDGNGGLIFPEQPALEGQRPTGAMSEISPDVYQALVFPIAPNVAAGIQINNGSVQPPPPKYCRVRPEQTASAAGAQQLVFIAYPATSVDDAIRATQYAYQNGIAILPLIECQQGIIDAGAGGGFGPTVTTTVITSPSNGQTFNTAEAIPVIGTAQFDSSQADFFHLDIIGGQWANWTPLGEEVYGSVVNGQLGQLNPYALPPGNYRLRVRLSQGGQIPQAPYEVSFTVTG